VLDPISEQREGERQNDSNELIDSCGNGQKVAPAAMPD
jgi:hypothetical protein